jgi:hypothetical protein
MALWRFPSKICAASSIESSTIHSAKPFGSRWIGYVKLYICPAPNRRGVYPDISAILEKQKMKDLVEAELVTLPEDSTAYGGVKAM